MEQIKAALGAFEQRVDILEVEFRDHVREVNDRFLRVEAQISSLITLQKNNVKDIHTLTKETLDIIQLHKDLQSVTRIGANVQSFGLWVVKWPLIGAGLYSVYMWLIAHLPK